MLYKSKTIRHTLISERDSEAGFTLLEMALIVVLGGILLSFLGAALLTFMHENQIRTTEHRLEKIQKALSHYLSVNGRYPCVANQTLGPSSNVFGREVTSVCDAGSFAGTIRRSGVRIGAVPTRTLNLPDEFLADAWGRKFKYAITEELATNQKYQADKGLITIKDDADSNIVTDAHYVVLSHGVTGDGAFPLNAATVAVTPCPVNSLDRRNCDDSDAIFRATLVNSDSNIANFYDDYVYYKNKGAPLGFPAGAVLPFESVSCPDGWTNFVRAEGRFVVGSQDAIVNYDQYIMRLKTTAPTTKTLNLSIGSVDEDAESNTPPYIALRYCEKLPI